MRKKPRTTQRVPQWTPEKAREFGKRLRELREAAHMSQRELSFPGCTAAYISRVEKGERYPSVVLMRGMAARLDVTVEYLETGQGRPLSVDVLLTKVCEQTDGLELIAFRKNDPRPGVDVHFGYDGATKVATGESLADALFGAVVWAGKVAALRQAAEARDAEVAEQDAELEQLLSVTVVNL